jgi:nicotinamidase-related amidase
MQEAGRDPLVVDVIVAMQMQSCFLSPAGTLYVGPDERERLMGAVRRGLPSLVGGRGAVVLATRMLRAPEDPYYSDEQPYCMVGSADLEMDREVRAALSSGGAPVQEVQHRHPDLMALPAFRSRMSSLDVGVVTLLGFEAQSGILLTAASMRESGMDVVVAADMVSSRDPFLRESALTIMRPATGARLT